MLTIDWPVTWRCIEIEILVEIEMEVEVLEAGGGGGRWGVAGSVIWPVPSKPELLIERLIVSISTKHRLYRQYCVYGA
ncbi:hypothetical protein P167DRAFT_539452 [Morchella conica CCBAS932]|uniref:Uncharacterized protein n=1 Tax=Morchella conica CCBAS932 TaxID=1392247 RepID=A0A3N4KR62_9PEZI|nr:hypothetical protein P167DRAFT_539452 [Morchella conica CCBAS932]